jgi:CDP-diacylglycerol---glycerol-3-phosphate 3-phosphatidyltransferase
MIRSHWAKRSSEKKVPMFNVSNGLSILRAPLAFLFFIKSTPLRLLVTLLAMLSDCVDGYLARRLSSTTRVGAILDPAMDKFFVFTALGFFLVEGRMQTWEACTLLSRDFFLCIFGLYLALSGQWRIYPYKAARWGKVTTALQFLVLIALLLQFSIPWYVYSLFVLFGSLAFIELCQRKLSRVNDGNR